MEGRWKTPSVYLNILTYLTYEEQSLFGSNEKIYIFYICQCYHSFIECFSERFFPFNCSFNDKLGDSTICFWTGVLHTHLMRTFRNSIASPSSFIWKCPTWDRTYWVNGVHKSEKHPLSLLSWPDLLGRS